MNICTCEVRNVVKPFSGLWSARPQNPDIGDLYYATDRGHTYPWLQPFGAVLSARWYKVGVGVVDDCDRANNASNIGTSQSGQAWSALAGTFGINTNKIRPITASDRDVALIQANTNNPTLQMVIQGAITNASNYSLPDVAFRASTFNTFLAGQIYNNTVRLVKWDGGTPTVLTQQGGSFADSTDYTMTIRCAGTNVKIWIGTTQYIDHTLTANEDKFADYTKVGVFFQTGGLTPNSARWDNLKCYEEAAA